MATKGSVSRIPAELVRAMFAVVCLDTGGGAMAGDWPDWWDHAGTGDSHRTNVEHLRYEVENAMLPPGWYVSRGISR